MTIIESPKPRFRQAEGVCTDSRSVAAEWGDGLLDADGDTKRLSRLEVGGANPLPRRRVAQQESASQIAAPTSTTTTAEARLT
jgi:hypothetical protein